MLEYNAKSQGGTLDVVPKLSQNQEIPIHYFPKLRPLFTMSTVKRMESITSGFKALQQQLQHQFLQLQAAHDDIQSLSNNAPIPAEEDNKEDTNNSFEVAMQNDKTYDIIGNMHK